jgi:ABC-2 type transport system permease protein
MATARYGRILARFCKNSLLRELSFRGHFIVNVASEVLWVGLLLIFVRVIFSKTPHVRGWTEDHYLFLLGTHMIITSLFETFFFGNCWRISQLVRTGNLDFVLVRPASTQFLLSFERVDYSALANVPVGIALCTYAVWGAAAVITPTQIALFLLLLLAGVTILYSLLYMFAITSIWLIRHTGVNHLWFYAVSLARYPHDIYKRFVGGVMWFALVFVIPILMVTNLPASVMVRTFHPLMVAYVVTASAVFLALSMVVSHFALRWYRSASS